MKTEKAKPRKMNKPVPRWSRKLRQPGFYVAFEKGTGFDVLFWPGADDLAFDLPISRASYFFGPFKLPVSA